MKHFVALIVSLSLIGAVSADDSQKKKYGPYLSQTVKGAIPLKRGVKGKADQKNYDTALVPAVQVKSTRFGLGGKVLERDRLEEIALLGSIEAKGNPASSTCGSAVSGAAFAIEHSLPLEEGMRFTLPATLRKDNGCFWGKSEPTKTLNGMAEFITTYCPQAEQADRAIRQHLLTSYSEFFRGDATLDPSRVITGFGLQKGKQGIDHLVVYYKV